MKIIFAPIMLLALFAGFCRAQNKPLPCTVSILALGQINKQKFTSPKDYLARYSGMDIESDKACREMIATGKQVPVAIPELVDERPPGPLMVYLDGQVKDGGLSPGKKKEALIFSLNLGGVSKRFPVSRGKKLDIYLAGSGGSSNEVNKGPKAKIHSIAIPKTCEEMLIFFIKPPAPSWKGYRVIPVDFSQKILPERSVLLINFSNKPLLVLPETSLIANKKKRLLEPGERVIFKIAENRSSVRLLYFDPDKPDKILCSTTCRARPDQRTLVFTFGLGTPENGVAIATRSLNRPVKPLKFAPESTPHSE